MFSDLILDFLLFLVLFSVLLWVSFFCYRYLKDLVKIKRPFWKHLCIGFRKKIWMTIGVGCVFFPAYVLLIYLGRTFLNQDSWSKLFALAYQNPIYFIYGGLFTVTFISLFIYFIRRVIIYIYQKG